MNETPSTEKRMLQADSGNQRTDDTRLQFITAKLSDRLQGRSTVAHIGRVVRAVGTSLRVSGLPGRIGQRCEVRDKHSGHCIKADVVGLENGEAILVPLSHLKGVASDSEVRVIAQQANVPITDDMMGRVIDGFGQAIDDKPLPVSHVHAEISNDAPNPLSRKRISQRLHTGIKAIDALLTVGKGQRLGIFAPAGAGKSTLLAMLASHTDADVVVIGLIGERGREVREFIEDALPEETRARAVIVVATSDASAMERVSAAEAATAVAEGFRDQGRHVLLLMDSVTRYARAVRELGLAVGEPPVRQGFTPSVFAALPRLFERAGNNDKGQITALYTVLNDDETGVDPISEETRSILDGHIVLSRSLAERGYFPAIDILASLSRLFGALATAPQLACASRVRTLLAKYRDIEFLLQVGEYKAGSDTEADAAVAQLPLIESFLQQTLQESNAFDDTINALQIATGSIANTEPSKSESAPKAS